MKANRTIILRGLMVSGFVLFFVWGRGLHSKTSKLVENENTSAELPIMAENSVIEKQETMDWLSYVEFSRKMKGPMSVEELSEWWDSIMAEYGNMKKVSSVKYLEGFHIKSALLRKWGEIAPLQGLLKLEEMKEDAFIKNALFLGWSDKNPEAALNYLDETYRGTLSSSVQLHFECVVRNFAKYAPDKAWNWIVSQQGVRSPSFIQALQKQCLLQMALSKNSALPSFMEKVVLDQTNQLRQSEAFAIGRNVVKYQNEDIDWKSYLPRENYVAFEAGRIISALNDNQEDLNVHLNAVDPQYQREVAREFFGRLLKEKDMNPGIYLEWISQRLDINELKKGYIDISNWMTEDRREARQWINSLPSGEAKDFFEKCYQSKGVFTGGDIK